MYVLANRITTVSHVCEGHKCLLPQASCNLYSFLFHWRPSSSKKWVVTGHQQFNRIFLWPFPVAFPIAVSFRISLWCMTYCMDYYTEPSLLGNSPAHSWVIQCRCSQGCYEGNRHSIQSAIDWSLHRGGGECVLRAWAFGNVWNYVLSDRLGHPTGEGCGGSGGKRRGCGHQRESMRSLPRKEHAELGPSPVLEEGLHLVNEVG